MPQRRSSPRIKNLGPLAAGIAVAAGAREAMARVREADLRGQVALITGGSRGLGLALAQVLAGEGCRLAICAREFDELDRAAKELEASGAEVLAITCDVASESDVELMVARVLEHYGQIDLLFTVAGVMEVVEQKHASIQDYRHAMDVMFWGTLYPILAVIPGMREQRYGRIATITSIGGKISVPHLLPYSAAKFAAVGLSEGLASELAQDGIRITTMVPGLMRTGSHLNAWFKGDAPRQRGNYTWFSIGASSVLNPRADRAAKIIVRAVKRGETEKIFPFPYVLASQFHGIAPAATARLMQLANALMPNSGEGQGPVTVNRGMDVEQKMGSDVLETVTAPGKDAAEAFNQFPGPLHTRDA